MNKLFLDANVLFAAAYRERAGLACLWHLDDVTLVTSAYACQEAERNLQEAKQHLRLAAFLNKVEVVVLSPLGVTIPTGVDLPMKDRPILEAAISAKATHLLTLDERHFGNLYGQTVEAVLILHPREYLSSRS